MFNSSSSSGVLAWVPCGATAEQFPGFSCGVTTLVFCLHIGHLLIKQMNRRYTSTSRPRNEKVVWGGKQPFSCVAPPPNNFRNPPPNAAPPQLRPSQRRFNAAPPHPDFPDLGMKKSGKKKQRNFSRVGTRRMPLLYKATWQETEPLNELQIPLAFGPLELGVDTSVLRRERRQVRLQHDLQSDVGVEVSSRVADLRHRATI